MRNGQLLPVAVGIALCTASVALFYKWYKLRSSTSDEIDAGAPNAKLKPKRIKNHFTKVESTISNDKVPVIIGRLGANVKSIEERTNAKIQFREKDEANQICEISGQYEDVMKAADVIKEELARSQSRTEEMIIPTSAHKKICRQSGKVLHDICQRSFTQIHIDAGITDKNARRLLITGASANIQKAKKLIAEKVRQDNEEQEAGNNREPRYSTSRGPSASTSLESLPNQTVSPPSIPKVALHSSGETLNSVFNKTEGQFEVYVSAVASPSRFWIQLVGPQTVKLTGLIDQMTEYYNQTENRDRHQIKEPYLGQIVAAMFQYDCKWYRAEIVGILPNDFDARKVILDLYFLDYGDSIYVNQSDVFEMRTDFLTLRYQAVECYLANVQPMYPEDGKWDHKSCGRFEELTHVAQWKKLIAKVVTTKERFKVGDPNEHDASPIPGIELYDTIDDREVNLAATLILENFAVPMNHTDTPTPLSRYSSSDSVLRMDGGQNHVGSVAEKALMFELTANLQASPSKTNGSKSPIPSPKQMMSPRKRRFGASVEKLSENNENIQNTANFADNKSVQSNVHNSLDDIANQNWADLVEAESDYT